MLSNFFSEILNLFFPETCVACNDSLKYSEKVLCTNCLLDVPRIYFHNQEHNPLEDLLWGQIPFVKASSLFYYTKKNKYSELIHSLKYKQRDDVGVFLGEIFAVELQKSGFLDSIDVVVPIPLHRKREFKRGYNQSQKIAEGIQNISGIPVDTKSVIRTVYTDTQTRKSKDERFKNVSNIFEVSTPDDLADKHILIIDDVITTGASCISCATTILNATKNTKISIASLGLTVF